MDNEIELRWHGPILDCSGYAAAARGYVQAADYVGIRIRSEDRSRSTNLKGKGMDPDILRAYETLSSTNVSREAPCVQHQVPDCFYEDKKTSRSIGFTIFEMTRIPKIWVEKCNKMDEIWTGSEYSKNAFINSGVKPKIHVIPHALDLERFSPNGPSWNIKNKRGFTFLSIFDFTERKAWKELLQAYWAAFSPQDDVCLILKVFFNDFSESSRRDILRRICKYKKELGISSSPPILVYTHDVPGSDMPGLYRSADCYVGISREGFGLGYAEAMACGLPAIGPEVGGTRQFMDNDNSFLVSYEGEEDVSSELVRMFPIFDGLKWSKHSWEDLLNKMRIAVNDSDGLASKAAKGTASVRKKLSYDAVGSQIKTILTTGGY